MNVNLLAYEEVADFIATLDPKKLLELKPSETVQKRVEFLIDRKKNNSLSSEEQYELDRYMALEHLIALAKVQARKRLAA
jgi:hypothetical protein